MKCLIFSLSGIPPASGGLAGGGGVKPGLSDKIRKQIFVNDYLETIFYFLGQITHGGGSFGSGGSGYSSGIAGSGGNVWVNLVNSSVFYDISLLSLLRFVQERNFYLKLFVLANDIINDENITKVCMLVQAFMLAVIWVVIIMDIIIKIVNN